MSNAQVIEGAQCSAGKVPEFGMIALSFELTDNCDRDDYFMLFKFRERVGVCQENAGIYNVSLYGIFLLT